MMSIVEDTEEITAVDRPDGATPQAKIFEETTTERCMVCGRRPGPVVLPHEDRFEYGMLHALGRLSLLMQAGGVPKDEAESIVKKLRAADVELP